MVGTPRTAGLRSMTSSLAGIQQRRRAPFSATNSIGGRRARVGVGTGISLPQYPAKLRIFGPISRRPFAQGKARVADLRLKNVRVSR